MICNKDIAKKTAEQLLEINAVKLQPNNLFQWASGWFSPIYCDNRIILSFPKIRNYIAEQFAIQIKKNYPETEVIAGVATGAIAIGILVSEKLNLPFVYVRPEPKSHGRKNQVEGNLEPAKNIIVIEDLISTGKSSMNAVNALRESGGNVLAMFAIFSYGFLESERLFESGNLIFKTLSDYDNLLELALKIGYIKQHEIEYLKNWRQNPEKFGR